MRAPLRSSPISLALASACLQSGSRLCAVPGSASSEVELPKLDSLMKCWEAEDKPRTEYKLEIQYPTYADDHVWKLGRMERNEPIPMTSGKNVSPKRVEKRRRQKKAARQSKRRNHRQNAGGEGPPP